MAVLLREVARAHRCFDALLSGNVAAMSELSAREGVDERFIRRILPLAFLAPAIVEAIAKGTQPAELMANGSFGELSCRSSGQTRNGFSDFVELLSRVAIVHVLSGSDAQSLLRTEPDHRGSWGPDLRFTRIPN